MPVDNELHKAAHKGDMDAVKMLIEGSVDEETPLTVNDIGASDRRPLHRAAGAGHAELVAYFVELGAEVNARDKSGRTALHWGSISGHSEIIRFLLEKGADITAETTLKNNCLHSAVEANRVETVRVLMAHLSEDEEKKTAITMLKNSDDKTAWDLALAAKNSPICTVLKEMGDANGVSSSCTIS
ncbi:ankyrin repeat-containing domain protein [Ochromonadaceae sp. CCMP2298]|nr:ankyrin repeat-containing domain protein [Ochromonadaceae sp. CCMP2298]|mmetsp:Transcript_12053/g.26831  ORF Transcript_12053/g.26831 Transcript_12053/m.26831 type:complete len:185 (-) Transcript_12053:148-702(-)